MKAHCLLPLILAFPLLSARGDQSRLRFDHGDPTPQEQLMLEMINRARANPGAEAVRLKMGLNDGLASRTIRDEPLPPLAFDSRLLGAARGHTRWMLDTGTFSHTGRDRSSPEVRMEAAGYFWGLAAENICYGGTTGIPDLTLQTMARHDDLFRSPGHRRNICHARARDIGLGVLAGRFQNWNAVMVTQDFGSDLVSTRPMVTGVVFEDLDGDHFYDPGEGLAGVIVVPEGGEWEAVTSASGGYAVPYEGNSGPLTLSFSGGPLPRSERKAVDRTGEHVKLDLVPSPFAEIVPGSPTYAPETGFSLRVTGTPNLAFALQVSSDLETWSDASRHVLGTSEMTVHHPGPGPRGFYRLRW